MKPLEDAQLQEIEDFIRTMRPLMPGVTINHRILGQRAVKGMLTPKAPHFVVISGKAQPYRDLCAGFLFQQLDLYLSARGIGTCWLGVTKGREAPTTGEADILSICFGTPVGSATRAPGAFKRKTLAEIAGGEDARLKAVRLAPSGRNIQPWYFIVRDGTIHVYKEIPGKLWAKLYDLEELDVGIALCHLALATEAEGKAFRFETEHPNTPSAPSGYAYVGTVL